MGRSVKEFEELIEKQCEINDKKNVTAVSTGHAALHLSLMIMQIKPGDEVISPALTVIMNTASTIHANAIPIYACLLYTSDAADE